jgi:hypothetical protein
MDHELNTLFGCISAWVTKLDTHSTFPAFNIKRLQTFSRAWLKNRNAIDILAALPLLDEPNSEIFSS